jgi:hypothetical protein
VLATLERLYAVAIEGHPGSDEFLDRMAWLPALRCWSISMPRAHGPMPKASGVADACERLIRPPPLNR